MKTAAHAVRTALRNPSSTTLVVVTLGIAIAVVAIIASTIDMVWHFIPAERNARLVFVASTDPRTGRAMSGVSNGLARTGVSIPDLVDFGERTTTFEAFAAFRFENATLTGVDFPVRIAVNRVTANLFDVWGVAPQLGRSFTPADGRAGAPATVLLSHVFWQRQLSGASDVLGTTLTLDGKPFTVIGILPRSINSGIFKTADVFTPLVLDRERSARDQRLLFTTALLKPGVSRERAEADLTVAAVQLQKEYPATNGQTGVVVRPFIELLGGNIMAVLYLLGLIGVFVVCIACANVSSIILAQSTTRQRELSVRAALGEGRFHQIRQLMIESVVVSAVAGVFGLILAGIGVQALRHVSAGIEGFGEIALNWRVLLVCVAVALAAPFAFALFPALRMSKPDIAELRQGGRVADTSKGRRLREALVVAQVALVLVLMTQVGLIARTTWRIHYAEKGLDPAQVLTFRMDLPEDEYGRSERVRDFFAGAVERVRALPGVTSAAAVSTLPIADPERTVRFVVEGAPPLAPEARPEAVRASITTSYFRTLHIPIVRGRDLRDADFGNVPPVALASVEAARRFFPNGDAIGRRIAFGGNGEWVEIVGVVGDVRSINAGSAPTPHFYVPNSWQPQPAMAFVVKSAGPDSTLLAPSIRRALAELDANVPLYDVTSMERELIEDLGGTYLFTGMLAVIAAVALLLAAAGVYGLVSFSVSQRTREIGLRMALGARPASIVRLFVGRGSAPLAVGLLVGSVAAAFLVSLTASAMEEIDVRDPVAYVAVWVPLLVIAVLATYIPARRATRVDPQIALRAD